MLPAIGESTNINTIFVFINIWQHTELDDEL